MTRFTSPWRGLAAIGAVLLAAVPISGGCSGGEEVGTCFFRCDDESASISLYGCKPSTKPDDDCESLAGEYCLTLGLTVARHQFEEDCFVDCSSLESCASCAPSWHGKMCIDEVDGGDAAADGEGGESGAADAEEGAAGGHDAQADAAAEAAEDATADAAADVVEDAAEAG